MMKTKLSLLILGMLFISLVSAGFGNSQLNEDTLNKYTKTQVTMIQNKFENKYMFNYSNGEFYEEGEQLKLRIQEQKRFMFLNVEMTDEYVLNDNGEIIQERHNLWSRLLNRNRLTEI